MSTNSTLRIHIVNYKSIPYQTIKNFCYCSANENKFQKVIIDSHNFSETHISTKNLQLYQFQYNYLGIDTEYSIPIITSAIKWNGIERENLNTSYSKIECRNIKKTYAF